MKMKMPVPSEPLPQPEESFPFRGSPSWLLAMAVASVLLASISVVALLVR